MAVTVVKRPTGHKIIDQAIEASIIAVGGDALVVFPYHGLGTGDTIYITSDIDEYNGFWYVTSIDANTFKISEYATADFVEYFQDLDIEFYQTNPHDWNSVFLPIVYKVSNDRWPVNTVDAATTIAVTSGDHGYLQIITAGVIKSDIRPLDFVKISNAADPDVDGVWQVIEVTSSSNIVIDALYTSVYLVGATVQFYYNNFQVGIKIFGGLPASHPWQAKKPFVEVAELSLTPDEDNITMFSVADYIKSKVSIKNNITLFSLPLNLDAFTGFYISVNESYDRGDGYTINRTSSDFAVDDFEGYAVAGKLPFKNVYSGDYADYVYTSGSPAMWLTAMERLLAVEDKYFDISFIKNTDGEFSVSIDKYVSDYLVTTETIPYTDQGIGVYRIPITPDSAYDSFCIAILAGGEGIILDNADFANDGTGGTAWITGSSPSVTRSSIGSSQGLIDDFAFVAGQTYIITVVLIGVGSATCQVFLRIRDSLGNSQFSDSELLIGNETEIITLSFVALADTSEIYIAASWFSNNSETITLDSITVSSTGLQLTEEICIDILESCEAQGGFVPTDIRLLEDGSYRLLE